MTTTSMAAGLFYFPSLIINENTKSIKRIDMKKKKPTSCSRSHWDNIVSGRRSISIPMAKKLESELKMPWRRLVGLTGKSVNDIFESACNEYD